MANGFFAIFKRKVVLTIPLPSKLKFVAARIVNGDLEVTLKVADKPSAVDFKRDGGGIDSARPWVERAK